MKNALLASVAALSLVLTTGAAQAQTAAAAEQPLLHGVAAEVQPDRMRADIQALVDWHDEACRAHESQLPLA